MTFLSPTQQPQATASTGLSLDEKAAVSLCTKALADLTDDLREANIKTCGQFMEQALRDGRRATAMFWLDRMTQGIKARSPRQIRKMEACYFDTQGEEDRLAMQGRAAL